MEKKKENGNVVIEASIVLTLTVVMIAVLINLGFMLYQKNFLNTVAEESAVNAANVYASTYRDPIYGYMDDSEFYKTDLYRYVTNIVTSSQDRAGERKAEWYSLYRLKKGEIAKFKEPKVRVQVIQKPGTIIQRQMVVEIEAEFEMPFTAIWGGDNKATYTAVGKAECVDLLDYFNAVGTVNETLVSKLDKLLSHFIKLTSLFK